MAPTIGAPAADFDLPATIGERISLRALRRRKVVLIFFPFAFTGVCTGALCELRDRSLDFTAVFLDFLGAANRRGTFVIDREGIPRWSVVTERGVARDPQEYLKALAEIA